MLRATPFGARRPSEPGEPAPGKAQRAPHGRETKTAGEAGAGGPVRRRRSLAMLDAAARIEAASSQARPAFIPNLVRLRLHPESSAPQGGLRPRVTIAPWATADREHEQPFGSRVVAGDARAAMNRARMGAADGERMPGHNWSRRPGAHVLTWSAAASRDRFAPPGARGAIMRRRVNRSRGLDARRPGAPTRRLDSR